MRFRPARLNAVDLPAELTCRFRCDGAFVGPLALVDLSTSGFALAAPDGLALAPGSQLESVELSVGDRVIWSGEAVVVHGSKDRIGARVTSALLDLQHLRMGATLESRLQTLREQQALLPAEWRAAVGDVRALLEAARAEIDDFEHNATHDPFHRSEEEAALFEGLRASWGARYYEQVAALHEMSKSLDEHASALGRAYASAALLPLLSSCQMHRRAYEKPLGYAGDFRMMELYFAHELSGDSMFGRFLHSISQNYTLGKTVVARESVMRDAVRATLDLESSVPARVLALAAGPALELRRLLDGTPPQRRPAQLILLDQDEAAHETAYRHLSRILLERPKGALPLTVECLHFSVRQLLKPQTPEEQHVVDDTLSNLDLAYSAGLYDYLPEPVAARLTQLLYDRLRPGGRLLLGNLMEARDTTWIMEYVLGWHLLYRTDEQMLRLAKALRPTPLRATVTRDPTGHCLFLDVTRPS